MDDDSNTSEDAAAYGRRQGCFKDFTSGEYSLQGFFQQVESLSDPVDSNGLIAEAGLQAARFPKPRFDLNTMDRIDMDFRYLEDDYPGPEKGTHEISPFFSNTSIVRDLRLPLELVELGTNPEADLKEYLETVHSKLHSQAFQEWLPLASVNNNKDEGLAFPLKCGRLRALLLRELETERISVSQEAQALEHEVISSMSSSGSRDPMFSPIHSNSSYKKAELITPPLSPMSDDTEEFAPDTDTCAIEIVSDPISPDQTTHGRLRRVLADDKIEADFCSLGHLEITSSPPPLPEICDPVKKVSDLNADVPIVLSSSSSDASEGITAMKSSKIMKNLGSTELEANEDFQTEIFEEALATTLQAHHYHANLMAEQEKYDPIDSISRIPVPIMDFQHPKSAWADHLTCAKQQFRWIRNSLSHGTLHLEHGLRSDDKDLKWAPFRYGSGKVSIEESLEPLSDEARKLLSQEPTSSLTSAAYIFQDRPLLVQRFKDEEDIEKPAQALNDEASPTQAPQIVVDPRREPICCPDSDSLSSLVRAASAKRKAEKTPIQSNGLLPLTNNVDATSKLLQGFMEMRAAKKPKITAKPKISNGRTQGGMAVESSLKQQMQALAPAQEEKTRTPAVFPEILIPDQRGIFIVSLGIGPSILRRIEAGWPADRLFDRDYSFHNQIVWSPGSAERKQVISALSFDADITLTPAIGIIVTNLLKVKQKPLPNSKTLPQIRDRLLRVSRKYETLIVLVSEAKSDGEFAGHISSSDIAAYADFVAFTAALQAGVTPYFVSGGEVTLAKWILALMCQYSPSAASYEQFMAASETTWELFFRRAGMNVAAAQVLGGRLFEEAGKEGLARFVSMSMQQRMTSYSQLLGGAKLLLNVSKVIDATWGMSIVYKPREVAQDGRPADEESRSSCTQDEILCHINVTHVPSRLVFLLCRPCTQPGTVYPK